uniref:Uncharacterized protein n=1 Tax=Glossina palpalis gambiensis TaxID=67801 RepID=A0A1B0BYZ6_9MUSC
MSAVLFTTEQQDLDLPSTINHNNANSRTSTTASNMSSFNNGDDIQLQNTFTAVYVDILGSKMNNMRIHGEVADGEVDHIQNLNGQQQHYCDGSDSGVEIASNANVTLQRALSSNSGGYASSHGGGLDDNAHGGVNLSCNSSMISCSSDIYDIKQSSNLLAGSNSLNTCRSLNSYECCSENGSESSSVAGPITMTVRRINNHSNVKKKVAMFEPNLSEGPSAMKSKNAKEQSAAANSSAQHQPQQQQHQQQCRSRLSGLKRAISLPRPSQGTAQQVRERLSEKLHLNNSTRSTNTCLTPYRASTNQSRTSQNKPQKPDNLPNQLSRTTSMSMQRLVQRTPSLSRARTPCTSEDGRWPGISSSRSASARRGMSVTPDLASLKMRSSIMASMEIKSNSSSPYGTLPRRRKQKSVEDLTGRSSRSSSISRETRMSTSVIMSSRKSLTSSYGSNTATPTQQKSLISSLAMSKRENQNSRKSSTAICKTRIYHETGSQTALTSQDLEKAFAGVASHTKAIDAVELHDQETQAEIRDEELERLRCEVRQLTEREQELAIKLKREREEKLAIQRELHLNTERVMGLLALARVAGNGKIVDAGTPTSDEGEGSHDSLLMLESQIQMSGHELIERQQEVGQLRKLCRSLQIEMERSLMQQECLMQQKAAIEQESTELQDFLQHEKVAMCDALKELENEYQLCKQQLANRGEEVKVLRDECRHLVRLNEQRRQENRTLQTKFAALETKSKELIMQQNASVSGATSALSGLHTRLDNLVEQLVFSYNISELDLEDIGFQNDSQSNISASGETSLDCDSTTTSVKLQLNGHEFTHQQHPQTLTFSQTTNYAQYQLNSASDGSLSPQRNQSFIAAVISAIRNATTHSGKRLLIRQGKRCSETVASSGVGGATVVHHHNKQCNTHQPRNEIINNGDDSDSTEMLDSETEPCLMMDNVLEDVNMPDSHSHNMVSSCTGMISQIEIPSELVNATTGDESLHNLSQAIVNRQTVESQVSAMAVQKYNQQINETSVTEEPSCHDSVAEMPSLVEYSATQAVVDQVIEVDNLVTKLLKVLRLIQIDNDNCIQQLIIDKNKLQQSKEDMLEKIKDLQDVNVKLQDELMDATQELMIKTNDLSNTKAEIQRHRNEIDRLTEDICNLSTLCSNYRKLSPSTELPPFEAGSLNSQLDDIAGILNLLKMWQAEGQLNDTRVQQFMVDSLKTNNGNTKSLTDDRHHLEERLRIYANQLQNVLTVLNTCQQLITDNPALQELRKDIEVVKLNANWSQLLRDQVGEDDLNAN